MNLYKYRIVANKNKTIFKLQKKAKFFAHLEMITTYQIEVPPDVIMITLFLLFPPALFILMIFVPDSYRETFCWEDVMQTTDPLALAAKKQSHQEQNQFNHKEQEKFTLFLMDL